MEKKHAVLFSTDISARGVDFPAVDWVIQVDCPEDTNTYIHRVGRTARYKSKGNALLMLLPSETKFAEKLKQRNIDLKKLATRADKQLTIQPVLEKLNAENREVMHLAKKACASYLKGVHIMRDKSVFNLAAIDTQKLAHSYGLLNAPQLTLVAKPRDDGTQVDRKAAGQDRVARLRMEAKARKLQKQLETAAVASGDDDSEKDLEGSNDDSEGEFFRAKGEGAVDAIKAPAEDDDEESRALPKLSKKALRKIKPDGPYAGKNKVKLDSDGKALKQAEFDSDYLTALRKGSGLNADGSKMEVQRDNEVSRGDDLQAMHVATVKKQLAQTKELDD